MLLPPAGVEATVADAYLGGYLNIWPHRAGGFLNRCRVREAHRIAGLRGPAPAPTPAVLAAGAFLLASSAGAALGVVTFA
jgi:hypothetical protein